MTRRILHFRDLFWLLLAGLGGSFSAHAQPIPTLDLNFKPVITRVGGSVSALAVQKDGKLVVAGVFNAINGVARNGLARLAPDGSVDPSFDVGAVCCGTGTGAADTRAPISAVALQADGKLFIGGSFSTVNGVNRKGIARLNADGTLDPSFDPGAAGLTFAAGISSSAPVVALVVQPDGKLLLGGYFTAINGVNRSGVARLNENGSLDTTFDPGAALSIGDPTDPGQLNTLALLPNGQVLVGGIFASFNSYLRNGLARLDANGKLDLTYYPDLAIESGLASVDGMGLQSDGRLVVSGSFDVSSNQLRPGLARFNPDGSLDLTFNPSVAVPNESYRVLAIGSDGKIIAEHQFTDANSGAHRAISRLNPNGTLDPSYSLELTPAPGNRLLVSAVAFQPDGSLLVGGNFSATVGPSSLQGLVRMTTSGAPDASFAPRLEIAEGSANVLASAVQQDGKVVLAGTFNRVNGVDRPFLARVNRDGTLDTAFAPIVGVPENNSRPAVSALLIQPDSKILIGGSFSTVNGTSRNGLARLNADGSLDLSFDVGSGTGGTGNVAALALQLDGSVLAAGDFSQFNGALIPWIVRLTSNGAVDSSYSTYFRTDCAICTAPSIHSIGVLSNGSVMISGIIERVESFPANGLARLHSDGTVDLTLVPAIQSDETVSAMVIGPDDKTTVAINRADPAGTGSRTRFLRLNPDGTPDADFKPATVQGDASAADPVSAMALDAGGRLVVAGSLTSVDGVPQQGVARLNPDGTLDTTFKASAAFQSGTLAAPTTAGPLLTTVGVQDDGGIIVGGSFAAVSGVARIGLARLQADPPSSSGGGGGGGGSGGAILRAPARTADLTFTMLVSGDAGKTYRIEASPDLRTWTAVGTVTGSATPQPFSDPGAKTLPRRFYRAVAQ